MGTTLGLTLLSCILVGSCLVGWFLHRESAEVAKIVPHIGTRQVSPPKDDMTWQELQDRLNASGLSVYLGEQGSPPNGTIERTAAITHHNAMWFGREAPVYMHAMEDGPGGVAWLFHSRCFLVTKHTNADDAKRAAAHDVDFYQRPAFAWGPFEFEGKKEVMDRVKFCLENGHPPAPKPPEPRSPE